MDSPTRRNTSYKTVGCICLFSLAETCAIRPCDMLPPVHRPGFVETLEHEMPDPMIWSVSCGALITLVFPSLWNEQTPNTGPSNNTTAQRISFVDTEKFRYGDARGADVDICASNGDIPQPFILCEMNPPATDAGDEERAIIEQR